MADHTPVNPSPPHRGDVPLDALVALLLRFVVVPIHEARLIALWICHTYVAEVADYTPYLHVHSPVPRCGKSVLLRILSMLVHDPFAVSDASPAAIFRTISQSLRTLIFDEYDAAVATNGGDRASDYTALSNAGFENGPGATIVRCDGPNFTPKEFRVYGPKVFGGIGRYNLKESTRDRSISIGLQRKAPSDQVERFRARAIEVEADQLRAELQAWAEQAVEWLPNLNPDIPQRLNDRQQDILQQLFGIAWLQSDSWLALAAEAATECLINDADDTKPLSELLLQDIRRVFDARPDDERMTTRDLVHALQQLDDAPWRALGGGPGGKGIDEHTLARRLAQFEIRPLRFRPAGGRNSKQARGYARTDFAEAWSRYTDHDGE